MITVNNRPEPYFPDMTVRSLLEKMKYSYPVLIIRINGALIDDKDYENTVINDEDNVEILHPICGG